MVCLSLPSLSTSFIQAALPSASIPSRFCIMNDLASFCASGNGSSDSVVSSIFAEPDGVNTFGFHLYFWRRQNSMCFRLLGLNSMTLRLVKGLPLT